MARLAGSSFSMAPLTYTSGLPSTVCRVAMVCRAESKGSSSSRGNSVRSVVSSSPPLRATTSSAASVGSPVICHCRFSW